MPGVDANIPMRQLRRTETAAASDTTVPEDGQLLIVYMDDGSKRQYCGDGTATIADLFGDAYYWPMVPELTVYTADESTLHLSGSQFSVKAGGVNTSQLANSAVTLAKLANIADATLLGNNTGGAAAPVALTASQARTLLGLVIGTTVQAYDLELTALAALVSAANKVPRFTGSGSADLLDFDTDPLLATDSNTAIPSQRAVKGYVDSLVNGVDWKEHCRVATTGNITLSGTQTIDGVAVIKDDRVLVKDQTSTAQNGIWICDAGAWQRAPDADSGLDLELAIVKVREGTLSALKEFRCSSYSITLGTTPITWLEWSAGTSYAADEVTLHQAANTFSIKTGGVGTTELANSAVTLAKLANIADGTILANNTGGAAAPVALTASQLRTLLSLVIGTNVQAWDADLDAIAALSPSNDDVIQRKAGAWANRTMGQLKIDLGISGTNTGDQTITLTGPVTGSGTGTIATTIADAELAAIAALTSAADKMIQFTGSGSAALVDLKLGTEAAYGGTITWTAGAAPSGASSLRQFFTRTGNLVTWQISLTYLNTGTTVTNVVLTFPSEFPTPAIPSGFTGGSVRLYSCDNVRLLSTPTGSLTNGTGFFVMRNAADTGFEIASTAAFSSGSYRTFIFSGSYFAA